MILWERAILVVNLGKLGRDGNDYAGVREEKGEACGFARARFSSLRRVLFDLSRGRAGAASARKSRGHGQLVIFSGHKRKVEPEGKLKKGEGGIPKKVGRGGATARLIA